MAKSTEKSFSRNMGELTIGIAAIASVAALLVGLEVIVDQ